jgi:protein TonB
MATETSQSDPPVEEGALQNRETVADAAPSAAPALEHAGVAIENPDHGQRVWRLSLLAAVVAHVAVIGLLVRAPAQVLVGGDGQELEAISVEVISSAALESRAIAQPGEAAAAKVVSATDGNLKPADSSAAAADQQRRETERADVAAAQMPDIVIPEWTERPEPSPPQPADIVIAREKSEVSETADDGQAARKPAEAETKSESAPAEAAEAGNVGAASARGHADEPLVASSAAAASPGTAVEYAKSIVSTLARNKPKATAGTRGTVRIGFAIAVTGEVREVRVARSSGQAALDGAALEAVRTTRFPAPPRGLTAAQLTYEIPYIFR